VGDTNHLGSSGTTIVTGLQPVIIITTSTSLTADLTQRVVIGADNITLNCNGHTINGLSTGGVASSSNIGILLNGRRGVIIQSCLVTNFYIGIQLVSSTRNILFRNNATGDTYGFLLSSSTFNLLVGNNATDNLLDGFRLESSNANGLLLNTANRNSGSGFWLASSSGNVLAFDTANANAKYGFALTSFSNNNLLLRNSACGNGIDAFQDTTSTGNVFDGNIFCTSSGLPLPPLPEPQED
jgi:parallel beta-helix repeat protein